MAEVKLDRIVSQLSAAQLLQLAEFQAKIDHLQNMPSFDERVRNDVKYQKTINKLVGGDVAPLQWDMKVIQSKQFAEAIGSMTPQTMREGMWKNVKHDDPDTLLVRHLEARDWDVDRALVMMLGSVRWRNEQDVVDGLLGGGDERLKALSQLGEGKDREIAAEVMTQLRSGKSYAHGTDKTGRPLLVIRTHKHNPSAQSLQGLEKYIIFQTESARMLMRPPQTDVCVIMDLGNFSMANMDWNAVKIMTLGLEEKYPESVGAQYIYRAPWIISGIWAVVKKMMPGKEAQKVRFMRDAKELSEMVDLKYLPADMGGTGDFEHEYLEPVAGENEHMKDTTKRDELMQERQKLIDEYEDASREWAWLLQLESASNPYRSTASSEPVSEAASFVSATEETKTSSASELMVKRRQIMSKLRENYWKLDPYVRGRTSLDRSGMLDDVKTLS